MKTMAVGHLMKKYLKRDRHKDGEALAIAALSTALASPHVDFAKEFSAAVRKYYKAAVSVILRKKRGVMIAVSQQGVDDWTMLKRAIRQGHGPVTVIRCDDDEVMQ